MGVGGWGLRLTGGWGLGVWVWGLGFGVWGLEFGVWGLGVGFGVWGLGCVRHEPETLNPEARGEARGVRGEWATGARKGRGKHATA